MNGDNVRIARIWFAKAENDLAAARQILLMEAPPTDTVCFHAQQCAEKYLKGLLTYYSIYFPRTHSLEDLAELCRKAAPDIVYELSDIEVLSEYGVSVRYPDEAFEQIPRADAEEALGIAEKVRGTVLRYVS